MRESDLERLRVYRAAEQLGDLVWEVVRPWGPFERATVGGQLVRAADSVGANIAEGAGRASFRDNRRYVAIARSSLFETRFFVRRAMSRGLVPPAKAAELEQLIATLIPALSAYRRSIGASKGAGANAPQPADLRC
jgi:four helix bundle protein